MKTWNHCKILSLLTIFILSFVGLGVLATPMYTITDLGTSVMNASSINELGQIVGHDNGGYAGLNRHPVLYSNGSIKDLGLLPENVFGEAYSINNLGQVVGLSYRNNPSYLYRAFLWENGVMSDLGTLGGTHSWTRDINDHVQIVGQAYTINGKQHAFLWEKGSMKDLGTMGFSQSEAKAINNLGQVVGSVGDTTSSSNNYYAFIWENGTMTNLGALPGSPNSSAMDINDLGQVAGYSRVYRGQYPYGWHERAVIWENGLIKDLGTLGGISSGAMSINNKGIVVGWSSTMIGGRAFLYDGSIMIDLNTMIDPNSGWVLERARDINDAGQIIGHGTFNGQTHTYLLNPMSEPIPEPSTILLLTIGIVGIAGYGFIRRRRA